MSIKCFFNKVIKIIVIIVLLFFVIISILFSFDDKGNCLSSGICKENIEVKTKNGLIKINEINCIKNNYKWNKRNKTCDLN